MRLLPIILFVAALSASTIPVREAGLFNSSTASLKAGDTLLVAQGTYDLSSWSISDISGIADKWITILADGKVIIRSNSGCCNLVQISNVHYLHFRGFELTMAVSNPSIDGINIKGVYSSNLVFDSLYIHHMTNVGFSMFPDSAAHIELRNSEIGFNTGSGIYWGYPDRNIVHDVLIKNNYIHNCPADPAHATHYGIQFKGWCYRARIEDNVLHDVGGTTRSGIIVYYGKSPLAHDDRANRNVVSANVLFNCRNEGITVMSDALVENNIVFDANYGINLQTYTDESFSGNCTIENLLVRNNTVFRCTGRCIALSGWSSADTSVSLTGNAAYQTSDSATAIHVSGTTGLATIKSNFYYGNTNLATGVALGKGLADFAAATSNGQVPNLDFTPAPGSVLLDLPQIDNCPTLDFFGRSRPIKNLPDAGAVERDPSASSPPWVIDKKPKIQSQTSVAPRKPAERMKGRRSEGAPQDFGAFEDPHIQAYRLDGRRISLTHEKEGRASKLPSCVILLAISGGADPHALRHLFIRR